MWPFCLFFHPFLMKKKMIYYNRHTSICSISANTMMIIGALPRTDSFKICLPEHLSPIFKKVDDSKEEEAKHQLPVHWIKVKITRIPDEEEGEINAMINRLQTENEEENEDELVEFDKYEKAYEEAKLKKFNFSGGDKSKDILLLFRRSDLPISVRNLKPGVYVYVWGIIGVCICICAYVIVCLLNTV
jgi:hypothetical protein